MNANKYKFYLYVSEKIRCTY